MAALDGNLPLLMERGTGYLVSASDDLRDARAPGELIRHLRHLQPSEFSRFDIGAMAGNAFGQLGEALWVAGEQVGIVERLLIGGD